VAVPKGKEKEKERKGMRRIGKEARSGLFFLFLLLLLFFFSLLSVAR
jgi:hypothetical protein